MNISIVEQKEGFVRIQVEAQKESYQANYKKALKTVAQSTDIKGFRQGKAPIGMIEKLMGERVRYETINRLVFEEIQNFVHENELHLIGWAMPEKGNARELNKEDMTLFFKMALRPTEYDFNFDGKKFTKYEVTISDEEVSKQLEAMQTANSHMEETDTVVEDAVVGGDIAELEGDTRKEDGILRENVTIYPQFMKDEEERQKFLDAGRGSVVVFNPYKAFEGNSAELTSLLGVEKEKVESLKDKEFSFQIETIRHMMPAELNQEFFDQVFGEDTVHNEEEAKAKLREYMQSQENGNADYKFTQDFLAYITSEKVPQVVLADDLIAEWYINSLTIDGKEEEVKHFDKSAMIASLKKELYTRALADRENLSVTDEDTQGFAREMVRSQFVQMGWQYPDPELINKYAQQQLEDEQFKYSIEMNILEQKVGKAIQEKVELETKQVTVDELREILHPTEKSQETAEKGEESNGESEE